MPQPHSIGAWATGGQLYITLGSDENWLPSQGQFGEIPPLLQGVMSELMDIVLGFLLL